jgi:hypothetical protein
MQMSEVNTEELVEAYLNIRNERERILREYEAQDERLKDDMRKIETAMLSVCNTIGADSIKTKSGTIMRKLTERFHCSDWENFSKYVLDNEALELLEKRIHQGNFKQHLSEIEGDGLPPGVNVMREFGVTVRKAS